MFNHEGVPAAKTSDAKGGAREIGNRTTIRTPDKISDRFNGPSELLDRPPTQPSDHDRVGAASLLYPGDSPPIG